MDKDGSVLIGKQQYLFRCPPDLGFFSRFGKYRPNMVERGAIKNRYTRRLLRAGFHFVIPMPDGSLLGFIHKMIIKLYAGETFFRTVFRLNKGSRPLGVAQGSGSALYWGEYPTRSFGEEVYIYSSRDYGDSWQKVYAFGRNDVRHIHNIIYDPFRCGHWVLTGDEGKECKICFSQDEFRTLEIIAEGSQQYRSVCAFPIEEGLLFATDTPLEHNYVYLLEMDSLQFHKITPLPGSVFYGAKVGCGFVISTAHEVSKANKTPFVHLYYSRDGFSWFEFYKQKKDLFEHRLFQHGTYIFPEGPNPGPYVYAGGQAVREDDGKMLVWDINQIGL